MGKEFRKALDRRGALRRNVGIRTMLSSIISLLMEQRAHHTNPTEASADALTREFQEFEQCASAYLRGEL